MVREHYAKLGFTKASETEDGATEWRLDLAGFTPVKLLSLVITRPNPLPNRELQPAE